MLEHLKDTTKNELDFMVRVDAEITANLSYSPQFRVFSSGSSISLFSPNSTPLLKSSKPTVVTKTTWIVTTNLPPPTCIKNTPTITRKTQNLKRKNEEREQLEGEIACLEGVFGTELIQECKKT